MRIRLSKKIKSEKKMREEKIKEKRMDKGRGLRKIKEIISHYKKKHRKLRWIIYELRKKNKILKHKIIELEGSLVPPKDEEEAEVGDNGAPSKFFSDCFDLLPAGAEIMGRKKYEQKEEGGARKRRHIGRLIKKPSSIVRLVKSRGNREKSVKIKSSCTILSTCRSRRNKIVEEAYMPDTLPPTIISVIDADSVTTQFRLVHK